MNPRILIVDDERSMCDLLETDLRLRDFTPRSFTSAREALDASCREDFEVVLTDLKMPNMDGLEFCSRLVANRPDIKAVNLMTLGVHGGRSQLLFRAALGDSIRVGIISLPNFYYGPNSWWKNSKGFRETMNEALGYFYVRFFFRPYENELLKK